MTFQFISIEVIINVAYVALSYSFISSLNSEAPVVSYFLSSALYLLLLIPFVSWDIKTRVWIYENKISIILISYNQESYIVHALDGVRNQSLTPDEVIIADDGSTDETQAIIAEYCKKNKLESKWKLLFSTVNKGINANLQNAINHSHGQIILIMAGDDISLPNQCQLSYDIFRNIQRLI